MVPDDEDDDEGIVDGGKTMSASSVVSDNGSSSSSSSSISSQAKKKLRGHNSGLLGSSLLARFAEPLSAGLNVFDSREIVYTVDDYGVSNTDLTFGDISTIDTRWYALFHVPVCSVSCLTSFNSLTVGNLKIGQLKLEEKNHNQHIRL